MAFFPDPPIPMTIIRAKLSIAWFTFGIILVFISNKKCFDLYKSILPLEQKKANFTA